MWWKDYRLGLYLNGSKAPKNFKFEEDKENRPHRFKAVETEEDVYSCASDVWSLISDTGDCYSHVLTSRPGQ